MDFHAHHAPRRHTAYGELIERVVREYLGRGLPESALRSHARGALEALDRRLFEGGNLSISSVPISFLVKELRICLEQHLNDHNEGLKTAREQEETARALAWKAYLSRGQPAESEIQRRWREYFRNRASLVEKSAPYELPNSYTSAKRGGVRLRIGLDFGTTGVKAAYRTEDQGDDRTIPLRLTSAPGIGGFILTPSLQIQGDQMVFRERRSLSDVSLKRCLSCAFGGGLGCGAQTELCPLKRQLGTVPLLAAKPLAEATGFMTSVYLGFILDRIRRAIRADLSQRFQQEEFRSFIHMCVPVGELENPLCRAAFQDTLTIADQMFQFELFGGDFVPIGEALKRWTECRALGIVASEQKRRSRVFPEVVAEMASYAMSKSAKPGVYALIDVGAGTIDVNIFRWVEPNSSSGARTPVFAAYCDGTGVLALEEHLTEILADQRARAISLFEVQKQKRTFPNTDELSTLYSSEIQPRIHRELNGALTDFSDAIARNSKRAWGQALLKRGKEKDWNRLGVFLGGGGSAVRQVREGLQQGMRNDFLKVEVQTLPPPDAEDMERLPGLPLQDFHRIAVAYGLTVADNFEGGLIWPKDIKPLVEKSGASGSRPKYEERFISKEMV